MNTKKNQSLFDDEPSLLDIIHFFKSNKRLIFIFVLMGALIGGLYAKFSGPTYKGIALIFSAKVADSFVIDPKISITEMQMNAYYSKETFLACNPDTHEDESIDYKMSDVIKVSLTEDNVLIKASMKSRSRDTITTCLESFIQDINVTQQSLSKSLFDNKYKELELIKFKLTKAKAFKNLLDQSIKKQSKEINSNGLQSAIFMILKENNSSEINSYLESINRITQELSSPKTQPADKALPINIERASFPFLELGLFLGFISGVIASILKK